MNSVSLYKQFSKHLFCHFTNYIRMSESSLSVTSLFCSGSRKIENSQIERHFLACIAFSLKDFQFQHFLGLSCFAFRLEENAFSENVSLFGQTIITLGLSQNKKIYQMSLVNGHSRTEKSASTNCSRFLKLGSKIVFL